MRGKRYLLVFSAAIALAFGAVPPGAQAQAPRPPAGGPGGPGGPPPGGPGQVQMAPPKPYKPVSIKMPQVAADPSFEAFRQQLGDIASRVPPLPRSSRRTSSS